MEDDRQNDQLTSYHVRLAREGSEESLEWVVKRLTPLLLANARYRLGGRLLRQYEPEDLVNEVWLVALPRLPDISPRDDRYTPVLVKFLSTTLLFKINRLIAKHIRRTGGSDGEQPGKEVGERDVEHLPSRKTTTLVSRLVREEASEAVFEALEKLDERDREIIIQRGIEQQPYKDIAAAVGGEDPKHLAVRYQRALEKLRRAVPASVYDEFHDH